MAEAETVRREAEETAATLGPLELIDFPHLAASYGNPVLTVDGAMLLRSALSGGSLPYELLNEYAFERLCFHILLAAGSSNTVSPSSRSEAKQSPRQCSPI